MDVGKSVARSIDRQFAELRADRDALITTLRELMEALVPEVNEKGAGGRLLARLADAQALLDGPPPPVPPPDLAAMLAELHEAFGQPFGDGPDDNAGRASIHESEHAELLDALATGDQVAIAHELADVVTVAFGTAHSRGIPLYAALAEVHAANMRKRWPDGRFRQDANGKLIKPPGWRPPDVPGAIAAWRSRVT